MSVIHLNIGSNQGDRHALIGQAVALLSRLGGRVAGLSSWHYSEAWGYESDSEFVNLGVAVEVDGHVDPLSVLDITQGIEREIGGGPHRNADGSYRDRALDIDIIAIDRVIMTSQRLTLPHPLAWQREFVMDPLRELAPPEYVAWLIAANRAQSAAT